MKEKFKEYKRFKSTKENHTKDKNLIYKRKRVQMKDASVSNEQMNMFLQKQKLYTKE